ncbi:hypothetical protein ACFV9D_05905 [Streptomyces sp. NPDC059875]|uniref:hypothetical protein n=1 Tax=unclassified Streptomyces TaxID=2593676 RepID=UPI00366A052F
MPSDPTQGAARRAVTQLDHRVEAAAGHNLDTLWAHRDRGVLDERHARLVDRHRELVKAETAVTFYRTLLHRLSSGEFHVDPALFRRIDRTVYQLKGATATRDAAEGAVIAALEPIETTSSAPPVVREPIPAADQAALLTIAGGAKLYEHLLTGRMSVATAAGTRIPYTQFQRLESSGLVSRDASHPLHAGQPVALTEKGRAALAGRSRRSTAAAPAPPRPETWPGVARPRR